MYLISIVLLDPPELQFFLFGGIVGKIAMDLKVSEDVYWYVVKLKIDGKFRSVDEALRDKLGLAPGDHPRLRCYEDDMNDSTGAKRKV